MADEIPETDVPSAPPGAAPSVIGGNTAEIRVRLTPRTAKAPVPAGTPGAGTPSSPAGGEVGKAVEEGVNAVKKIFR